MGHILKFSRPALEARDWRNDELAELYRVENSLIQAGVSVSTARGISDEGDPWFVFCGANEDVIVHIARYDGVYHIYARSLDEGLQGRSFTDVTKQFISRLPMQMAKGVTLHPSALFGLMVATLFFAVDHRPAHAAEKAPSSGHSQSLVNTLRHYVRVLADRSGEKTFSSDSELETVTQLIVVAVTMGAETHISPPLIDTTVEAFDKPSQGLTTPLVVASQSGPSQILDGSEEAAGGPVTNAPAGAGTKVAIPTVATVGALETPASGGDLGLRPLPGGLSGSSSSSTAGAFSAFAVPHFEAGGAVLIQSSGMKTLTESLANGSLRIVVAQSAHVSLDLNLVYAKGTNAGHVSLVLNGDTSLDLNELTVALNPVATGSTRDAGMSQGLHELSAASTPVATGSSSDPGIPHSSPQTAIVAGTQPSPPETDAPIAPGAPILHLTVASGGPSPNTLTVGPDAGADLNTTIYVTGSQDLQLNENASNLSNFSVDSTQLQGSLTIGIDLNAVNNEATLISQSNFVVGANSSLALLNVNENARIEIGIDLANAIIDMNAGATSLDLQLNATDGAASGVSVVSLSAAAVTNLAITSLGGSQEANSLASIHGDALYSIAITGDAPLTVGAFVMSTTGGQQPVTVDASQFGASLHIDLTGLAASLSGQAGITIKLGAAGSQVTDLNTTTPLTIVGGGGVDAINLGAGGTQTIGMNLTKSEYFFIGGGSTPDVVVDATKLASVPQSALNALTLIDAAQTAATAAGSANSHQAVLFNYGSNSFVFVDALGNHTFNSAKDAIVELVGVHTAPEIVGQFHSV